MYYLKEKEQNWTCFFVEMAKIGKEGAIIETIEPGFETYAILHLYSNVWL